MRNRVAFKFSLTKIIIECWRRRLRQEGGLLIAKVVTDGQKQGPAGLRQPRGTEGRTRLSDFTLTFHFHALEKEMATHSSVLAWRIPGTGGPSGLPSMGSHRVGHD